MAWCVDSTFELVMETAIWLVISKNALDQICRVVMEWADM